MLPTVGPLYQSGWNATVASIGGGVSGPEPYKPHLRLKLRQDHHTDRTSPVEWDELENGWEASVLVRTTDAPEKQPPVLLYLFETERAGAAAALSLGVCNLLGSDSLSLNGPEHTFILELSTSTVEAVRRHGHLQVPATATPPDNSDALTCSDSEDDGCVEIPPLHELVVTETSGTVKVSSWHDVWAGPAGVEKQWSESFRDDSYVRDVNHGALVAMFGDSSSAIAPGSTLRARGRTLVHFFANSRQRYEGSFDVKYLIRPISTSARQARR